MATNPGTEEVIRYNHDLDEILVVERNGVWPQVRFLTALRKRRFNLIVDLTDGDRSAVMGLISGARYRIGFNKENRWRGLLYTHIVRPVAPMHIVDYQLEALQPLGFPISDRSLILNVPLEEIRFAESLLKANGITLDGPKSETLVIISPGSRWWFKSWPPERYAQIADFIQTRYRARVILSGSKEDLSVASQIESLMKTTPISIVAKTTILQLAAVMKHCHLFIGNDSGPMHIAAAVGISVIALFGPTDPKIWGPLPEGHTIFYKGLDCHSCWVHYTCEKGEESCMKLISVEEVLKEVDSRIGKHSL